MTRTTTSSRGNINSRLVVNTFVRILCLQYFRHTGTDRIVRATVGPHDPPPASVTLAAAIAPKRMADPVGLRMDELPEDPPGALRPTASAMLPSIVRTSFLGVLPVPLHFGRASVKFRHVNRLHRLGYDGRCGSETSTTHTEIKRPSRSSSDCSIFTLTSSAVSGVQPAHFVGRHFSVAPNQNTR